MAEAADLLIGSVDVTELFDNCLSVFDRFETAASYGEDYEKKALKILLLQLRLSRWMESIRLAETGDEGHNIRMALSDENERVKSLLENIHADLEDAERRANRSTSRQSNLQSAGGVLVALEQLISRVRKLNTGRQQKSPLVKEARWALRDPISLTRLVEDLCSRIADLESLVPATKQHRRQLVKDQVDNLVRPFKVEDSSSIDADTTYLISLLRDDTYDIDRMLQLALNKKTAEMQSNHHYGTIDSDKSAKVELGDSGTQREKLSPGYGHKYDEITAKGNSEIYVGDKHGGKNIFDDISTNESVQPHEEAQSTPGE